MTAEGVTPESRAAGGLSKVQWALRKALAALDAAEAREQALQARIDAALAILNTGVAFGMATRARAALTQQPGEGAEQHG